MTRSHGPQKGHGGAPRTRPTRAQTRERVMTAALEVFGERGIAASTLNDIAAAAGLTRGAVYSNFAGKDDLVLAIMEEHAMQRLTASLATIDDTENVDLAIANVGTVLIDAIRSDAVWHRLLAEFFALSYHDPDTRIALRNRRREAREAVARALTRLSKTVGVDLPMPADRLAIVLFALSNGLGVESGIDPDAVPDDLMGTVIALLGRDFLTQVQAKTARQRPTPAKDPR
jgi:AcrR family transcriptional regulator